MIQSLLTFEGAELKNSWRDLLVRLDGESFGRSPLRLARDGPERADEGHWRRLKPLEFGP